MDVVNYWAQQVEKWNEESKCDLCWDFGAPLTEWAAETYQIKAGKECCVQVLLLFPDNVFSTNRTYASSGLITNLTCTNSFQVLFLLPSRIDINNYNEIPGHSIEESKWFTVFNKLKQCIECDAELDFCEILGTSYNITNWSARLVNNYTSNNYAGFRLNVSFQQVK